MAECSQSPVTFHEMHGIIEPRAGSALTTDALVLSNIERGTAFSPARTGLCIRYVARGREDYRIGGRAYRLDAGHVMVATCDLGTEIDIRKSDSSGTLGLCALLLAVNDDAPWLFGPLVLSAQCTELGMLMDRCARSLRTAHRPAEQAAELVAGLRGGMPALSRSVLAQAARVHAAKQSTRYDMVRRANLAQAYLHDTLNRAVDLDELGRAVGTSPFQLLRAFQHCFGDTPAGYHRKLRLERALDEAGRRGATIAQVADDYGFAGVSSFSHAYRRSFGHSPRQALCARAAGC